MMNTDVSSVPAQRASSDGEPVARGCTGVDRSTLQLIAHLFPAETRGQVFFTRFCERAAAEQSVIPNAGVDTVYICTQSIATLGEELGFSNDTTHKYVKLYMALGLLRKQKFLDKLAFLLFVGIYHPPLTLASNLDFLIQKSRPRLHDMAVNVKARCRIYGLISQDLVSALEQLQALLDAGKGTSRRSLEQRLAQAQYLTSKVLKVVLTSHLSAESPPGDGTRRQREHMLPENLPGHGDGEDDIHQQGNQESPQQHLLKEGRWGDSPQQQQDRESPKPGKAGRFAEEVSSARLPEKADQGDSSHVLPENESPKPGSPRRFDDTHDSSRLPAKAHPGDSLHHDHTGESPQDSKLERFPQKHAVSRLSQSTGEGDSDQGDQRPSLVESPQEGKAGRRDDEHLRSNLPLLSHRGDSGGALRNVDVKHIYTFITSTLREPKRVAEFLAEQLEGDRRVFPKYQKLFHVQEGQARDPHVLAAAFICTMVRWHRDQWSIHRPGGFFTKRCREYDAGVPEEVEDWITGYGQLSPAALLEALVKERPPDRAAAIAVPVPSPSSQKPAPKPLLPPLALSSKLQVEPARMVMSKSEAQTLVQAVLRDPRTQLLRAQRLRLGKEAPRYAVLVDASIPGGPPHQTVVYSCADWQGRLEAMKTWRDLIYPPASGPPRTDLGGSLHGKETSQ
ncbi:MAG TPA: hypothetical protein VIY29_09455 [Ktedonobacteraceae bacterium]